VTCSHDSAPMPSSQHSPRDPSPAGALARRRSRFTYRNLSQMASYSTSCPLRVVTHIDLDCFYAQAEMVRLGVPEDQPLAVQQWCAMVPFCSTPSRNGKRTDLAKAGPHCCQLPGPCLWYRPDVYRDGGKEVVSQPHQPACRDLAGGR
jgi:DNA polymerase eta